MVTMDVIEILYLRFTGIWGDRFTAKHNDKMIEIWHEEWCEGLQGLDPNCFREALKYCKENLEWSPSIAEFIRICDRSLNIPDPRQCMEAAIRADFYHPIIQKISQKITSWDLRNETAEKLLKRFTELHNEEMIDFRRKRSLQGIQLKQIEGESHGSEISRDNIRTNGMRKVEGYLF